MLFLVAEDWYFVSHRLDLAIAARRAGYDVVVATRVNRHADRIAGAGLKLCPLQFDRGGINPLTDIKTLLQIGSIYRRERPDIVHHVALKPVIYGSIAAGALGLRGVVNALGGLGYVFSAHGLRAKLLRLLVQPALRIALRGGCTRIIVQNRDDFRRIVAMGWADASRIRLIRGAGVDPALYPQVQPGEGLPLVILPARLLREKGVGEFVDAARLLRARGIKARFALVGSPDPENPSSVSQDEIDSWIKQGAVEYWGWREDMPKVFAMAQIVCLPTFYGEGIPKSLIEAAAAGSAIVTTENPGCQEIVQPGVSGWVVPVRDVAALAEALKQAIERPDLRQQYSAAARALIVTDFSMERVTSETLAIYRELTGPAGKDSPGS